MSEQFRVTFHDEAVPVLIAGVVTEALRQVKDEGAVSASVRVRSVRGDIHINVDAVMPGAAAKVTLYTTLSDPE